MGLSSVLNSSASLLKSNPTNASQDPGIKGCDYFFWRHLDLMKHRVTLALLFGLALAFSASTRVHAQPRNGTAIQETDDEVKVSTYKRFVDNREPNPGAAYQAAKDYLARYSKEDDQYTRYLKQWMAAFEKDERQDALLRAIYGEKNYAAAFGMAKQVLADDPEDVKTLIALGYGGYLASTNAKNETFNADSTRYALKAIQLLESGKSPDAWEPFKNREDALASLYYAIGFTELKPRPEEAIGRFIKVTQIDSDLRKTASTYYLLAVAYEQGPYKRLSADYTKRFANQPETPESKTALENLNKVMDRIVDAYARAVALAPNDAQHQAQKAEWTKRLTDLYKFRHEGSDTGLSEFIGGALAKPLPQP
jgi:tetratricopeptide (TPR) repeat protein